MVEKKIKQKIERRHKIIKKKLRHTVEKERITAEKELKVIPTGIASFDAAIGGGFPTGSLVVLAGEIGSGHDEFVMTSSVMLAAMKAGRLSRPPGENIVLPEDIWWVTFTRPQSDLMSEMALSFDSDLYEPFQKQVKFKDLSGEYFATSSVPLEWASKELFEKRRKKTLTTLEKTLAGVYRLSKKPSMKPKGMLSSLADFLIEKGPNSVVVLNTLTDLARLYSDSEARWYEFMIFLRGLQRVTKKWGGIIYANLDANLLEKSMEEEIAACVDGVATFEWMRAGPTEQRRTLYIRKFRRMPSPVGRGIMRFDLEINPSVGLQVIRPEFIMGLKM
jgi:archaellum biogenesis ATPase FlaH